MRAGEYSILVRAAQRQKHGRHYRYSRYGQIRQRSGDAVR